MLLIDAHKTAKTKDTLQKFAFQAFEEGRGLFNGTKKIASALELFQLELATLCVDQPIGVSAGLNKTAAPGNMIFNQPVVPTGPECPHCQTKMKVVKLADSQEAVSCPVCRHTDYASTEKGKINAGSPSVEKHLELRLLNSGHCDIRQK